MALDVYERIGWSADVEDEAALRARLPGMPGLRVIKIDRLFQERNGKGVMSNLREDGFLVFDDAKIAEIPSKALELALVHLQYRPWMLNCMAGNTSTGLMEDPDPEKIDGLKRFAAACLTAGTKPCAVTVLTSKSPDTVGREFNGRTSVDQVLWYVQVMLDAGFTDVVCSPAEIAAIRSERCFDVLELNTPAVRPTGSAAGDQARVDTPRNCVLLGGTRVIIGRPFTNDTSGLVLPGVAAEMVAAQAELDVAA